MRMIYLCHNARKCNVLLHVVAVHCAHTLQRAAPCVLSSTVGPLPVQRASCCRLLGSQHKPCATGGMLPLSATLATNSIFAAFQDSSKLKALLHGHSYTAHAIGCSAAVTALDLYLNPGSNPNLQSNSETTGKPCLQPLWDEKLVDQLSKHDRIRKVVALGRHLLSTIYPSVILLYLC